MGLLSLPKLRIYILIFVSAALFIFVFFKLLPSAEIKIVPREDTISQTANIFLVLSGSTVDIPDRVRTMELWPVKADITKTITYDQISKQFIGESARADITIVNNAEEVYSLRSGSRLVNQAGMIFRMLDAINIEPGEQIVVRAKADDLDLYGEIIGERGNVPAELKWDFAGLSYTEQDLVYGINEEPGRGGTTAYREVLAEEDLQAAKTQLMSELHNEAKQLVDEKRDVFNAEHENQTMEMLYYEELTTVEYDEIDLPRQFIGIPTQTIPVEGTIHYTAFAYDSQYVLELLAEELKTHVGEGRRLLNETVNLNRLIAHVIDYSDDLSWIKLTVDLSGTEQYVLDPLSPWGARFAKSVRDLVTDLGTKEAKRIIKNLPEVEEASIHLWPPWNRTLPAIPSQIKITPVLDS